MHFPLLYFLLKSLYITKHFQQKQSKHALMHIFSLGFCDYPFVLFVVTKNSWDKALSSICNGMQCIIFHSVCYFHVSWGKRKLHSFRWNELSKRKNFHGLLIKTLNEVVKFIFFPILITSGDNNALTFVKCMHVHIQYTHKKLLIRLCTCIAL